MANSNSLEITINGEWGPWSSWSSCSLSCGKGGMQRRQRECDDPTPRGKGMTCVGEDNQSKTCNQTTMCPNQGMQNSLYWKSLNWKNINYQTIRQELFCSIIQVHIFNLTPKGPLKTSRISKGPLRNS